MTRPSDVSIVALDTMLFGETHAGCAYLLRGAKTALIDAGTAAEAPRLLDALRGLRLDFLFVTHVHLDHAGAAGHVAAAHPEARVVVHPRGLPHLADPSRLVAGVRAASPDLAPLYGNPFPIDPRRLVPAEDGQVFSLGSIARLVAIATPGHAPHHVAFLEPASGVLFVGDAVGHCHAPVGLPLTVPPRFDIAASSASVDRLASLEPRALAFAHFGIVEQAKARLAAYPREVDAWLADVARLRKRVGDDAVVDAILHEPRHAGLSAVGRHVVRLCVRGALLTLDASVPFAG